MSGPIIIGGGPAGAAAATLLARAGHAVTLIERTAAASHKVCGDFLSAEAIEAITALGVDLYPLAPAPITALRLVHGKNVATARLPFPAFGLTRRSLDEALLRHATDSGATLLRGHAVRSIRRAGTSLELDAGVLGAISADTVFLATGKHDLRGMPRPGRDTGPVGLKMYFALDSWAREALRGHIELVLFAGGYAGLQLVETDHAVLCLLVSRARMLAVGGRWDALLDWLVAECPHLADRLHGGQALLGRPLAIAGLPYGYMHAPAADDAPGLFRLGDQATVIASLTGDGVALALASASLAAQTWLQRGDTAQVYQQRLVRVRSRQMRLASLLHRLSLDSTVQPWLLRTCRAWPGAMRLAASWTRCGEIGG